MTWAMPPPIWPAPMMSARLNSMIDTFPQIIFFTNARKDEPPPAVCGVGVWLLLEDGNPDAGGVAAKGIFYYAYFLFRQRPARNLLPPAYCV
jgi:hypothetical protein